MGNYVDGDIFWLPGNLLDSRSPVFWVGVLGLTLRLSGLPQTACIDGTAV